MNNNISEEKMEKKSKRIRHPKKIENKESKEEKKNFVLEVHDSNVTSKSKIGS